MSEKKMPKTSRKWSTANTIALGALAILIIGFIFAYWQHQDNMGLSAHEKFTEVKELRAELDDASQQIAILVHRIEVEVTTGADESWLKAAKEREAILIEMLDEIDREMEHTSPADVGPQIIESWKAVLVDAKRQSKELIYLAEQWLSPLREQIAQLCGENKFDVSPEVCRSFFQTMEACRSKADKVTCEDLTIATVALTKLLIEKGGRGAQEWLSPTPEMLDQPCEGKRNDVSVEACAVFFLKMEACINKADKETCHDLAVATIAQIQPLIKKRARKE